SSDVCSSDLSGLPGRAVRGRHLGVKIPTGAWLPLCAKRRATVSGDGGRNPADAERLYGQRSGITRNLRQWAGTGGEKLSESTGTGGGWGGRFCNLPVTDRLTGEKTVAVPWCRTYNTEKNRERNIAESNLKHALTGRFYFPMLWSVFHRININLCY